MNDSKNSKKDSRKARRRSTLLQASAAVFAEKGYARATVDDVAAQAGVSKGTMYNYFQSKEDLFTQLFLAQVEEDEQAIDEIIGRNMSAMKKLDEILEMWYRRFARYHEIGRLVLEFWTTIAGEREEDEKFSPVFGELYDRYRERFRRIFSQGVEEKAFMLRYDPNFAASQLLALMDGIGLHAMLGVGPRLDDEYRAAMREGVFRALGLQEMDS